MAITKREHVATKTYPTNAELAVRLRTVADLLEAQGASMFRVRAYRNAAATIETLVAPLWRTLEAEGIPGLVRFPTIGRSIAAALAHMIRTGKFSLLERLQGEDAAERLFTTVADIGPKLAARIHEQLGIETLGELQAAANDGRLAQVPGFGKKRLRAVRESLAGRFRGAPVTKQKALEVAEPTVSIAELLDVDHEYRELAKTQQLPRIAPRRFNPTQQAWLPVLHTERESRHFTALFSNTARAHELGAIRDWVVIYRDDDSDHGQWTVITSNFGKLRGRRIVRGREPECVAYYDRLATVNTPPRKQPRLQQTFSPWGAHQ